MGIFDLSRLEDWNRFCGARVLLKFPNLVAHPKYLVVLKERRFLGSPQTFWARVQGCETQTSIFHKAPWVLLPQLKDSSLGSCIWKCQVQMIISGPLGGQLWWTSHNPWLEAALASSVLVICHSGRSTWKTGLEETAHVPGGSAGSPRGSQSESLCSLVLLPVTTWGTCGAAPACVVTSLCQSSDFGKNKQNSAG